jgi:aminomuconate-semialdehyde/2-hydroxymuconate-6-semialdehyde dehydrogenase
MKEVANFINGEWVKTGNTFDNISPVTGQSVAVVHEANQETVDDAVSAAQAAMQGPWGKMPLAQRCQMLYKIADEIERRMDDFVAVECEDVGVPEPIARAIFIGRAAHLFRLYADQAKEHLERAYHVDTPDGGKALAYTFHRPKGVVAAIAPWNVPMLLLAFKVAPALAAGNAIVAKPSEVTPRSATLLAEVMQAVGVPDGVYNVVQGFGRDSAGQYLTQNQGVMAYSFTGESSTGASIMREAATGLRDVSLELGGKNPAIIFADANLDAVFPGSQMSCFSNTGQICFATERTYVERPLYEEYVERLSAIANSIKVGGPFEQGVQMGPLVSQTHREKVTASIDKAAKDGGQIVCGGGIPEFGDERDGGFFIQPTIVIGLPETADFVRNEIFGPVTHIQPFDDEAEAIAMATDTAYGLASTIWTQDISRGHRVAAQMQSGLIWLNCWQLRDLKAPFSGHGLSGVGTQGGTESLEFFSDVSTVTLKV